MIWLLKKSGPLGLKEEETHTAQGRTSMLLNQHKATPPLLQFAPLQWLHPMQGGKKQLDFIFTFYLKKNEKNNSTNSSFTVTKTILKKSLYKLPRLHHSK